MVTDANKYIYRLRYRSFVPQNKSPEVWTVTYYYPTYGKCFTPVLDPEIAKKGIKDVMIYTKGDMQVFLHTPGVFHTQKQKESFEVDFGKKVHYKVNHEILKLLTFQNETCIDDPNHNKDKCTHDRLYKVCKT